MQEFYVSQFLYMLLGFSDRARVYVFIDCDKYLTSLRWKKKTQTKQNTKDFHRRQTDEFIRCNLTARWDEGERERRPAEGAVDIGVALFVTSDPACVNSPPGSPLQPLDGSQAL